MNFDFKDFLFFGPMILIVYFMIFLPKRREQQAMVKMFAALKKGDRVLTHAGIYGEVFAIKENVITLKFSDNTRIDFTREAIKQLAPESAEVTKA